MFCYLKLVSLSKFGLSMRQTILHSVVDNAIQVIAIWAAMFSFIAIWAHSIKGICFEKKVNCIKTQKVVAAAGHFAGHYPPQTAFAATVVACPKAHYKRSIPECV